MISKIVSVVLQLSALFTCLFLFVAFSSLLSFFPWGNDKAYVIWEPLLLYYVVPDFMIVGIAQLFALKAKTRDRFMLSVIGLMLLLPTWLSFDLETDKPGRWAGVIVPLISVAWICASLFRSIKSLSHSKR